MRFSFDISAHEILDLAGAKAREAGVDLRPDNAKILVLTPVWGDYCMSEEGQREAFASGDLMSGLVVTFEFVKNPPGDDTKH